MHYLWLSENQAREMMRRAKEAAPSEICGILAGKAGRVERVIPVENIANDPQTRFLMDPVALSRLLPQLMTEGLSVLSFYHSHPDSPPIPSETDVREAAYPDVAHLIISLQKQEGHLAAWRIQRDKIEPIPVHIGINPPLQEEQSLSTAQQTAIILAAFIAVSIVLIVSISLLPPAPPIPPQ